MEPLSPEHLTGSPRCWTDQWRLDQTTYCEGGEIRQKSYRYFQRLVLYERTLRVYHCDTNKRVYKWTSIPLEALNPVPRIVTGDSPVVLVFCGFMLLLLVLARTAWTQDPSTTFLGMTKTPTLASLLTMVAFTVFVGSAYALHSQLMRTGQLQRVVGYEFRGRNGPLETIYGMSHHVEFRVKIGLGGEGSDYRIIFVQLLQEAILKNQRVGGGEQSENDVAEEPRKSGRGDDGRTWQSGDGYW